MKLRRIGVIAGTSALVLAASAGISAASVAGTATIDATANNVSAVIAATSDNAGFTCELEAAGTFEGSPFVVRITARDGQDNDPDNEADGVLNTTLTISNLPDGEYTVRVHCDDGVDDPVTLAEKVVTLPAEEEPSPPVFDFFGSLELLFGSS